MTTFTDKELIKEIRERIGSLDVRDNIERRAYEIALASLEAEPIGFRCRRNDNLGDWSYVYHREPDDFERKHLVIEGIYAAPPAPVVPEEKPIPNPLSMYAVDAVAAIAEVRGWNACRAAMLQSGNFRENKNSSTNNFREIAETSTNYPVIPSEVLSAILKVAKIRADFDDFDGDRRGIGDCLDEAEQELIVTINKYASQLAAEPIATNDVREQTAVPPVPVIQADVAQAIEKLKRKLVECNRYNYCADAVKGVEYACHAAMLQGSQPVSNHEELPLDYLQGQKDGLEWAAQLAEANHPQTGDWLYDDPLELAKAIRKGPDMPEFDGPTPVTPDGWISCSERMPEETGDIIVVSDCIVMSGISYSRRDGFYIAALEYDDDEPIGGVTHWMPLPEPPQEVNRG
ncbi:TPA: DUF551 domain-containing protein [Escherichia coli]|nr:DUF551 domain-containing protein [Escherichia coli]EIM7330115.1 DUF551 domain-containing protein [Escherichia coli]EJZ1719029.1 DUF551 domain-containing protein [Escherichia coli]HCU4253286.1 DUF551 domain-containing protein [Escherichia coli]HCU5512750.1 DUF551 domain-containing protein [Escherichia coli]